jgi:hypothetical protein
MQHNSDNSTAYRRGRHGALGKWTFGPTFFSKVFSIASRCELVQKYFDGWQESKKLPR